MTFLDTLGFTLIIVGIVIAGIASVGLLRFPDVLSRMHAASKPQTFGLILFSVGVVCVAGTWEIAGLVCVVVCAQLITITASSVMLGRAAFRRGFVRGTQYRIDELTPRLAITGEGDDDDDGFLDDDPQANESIDISEKLPENRLTKTAGLELVDSKEFWDEADS